MRWLPPALARSDFQDLFLETTESVALTWTDGVPSLDQGWRSGAGLRFRHRDGPTLFHSLDNPTAERVARAARSPSPAKSSLPERGEAPRAARAVSPDESDEIWRPSCPWTGGGWELEIPGVLAYLEEAAKGVLNACRGRGPSPRIHASVHLYRQAIQHETMDRVEQDVRGGVRVEVRAASGGIVARRRVAAEQVGLLGRVQEASALGESLGLSLLEKTEGLVRPDGGFSLIFASGGCGALIHEIGHLFETDLNGDGMAGLAPGRKVGDRAITILDDPAACSGRGVYRIDDEGEIGVSSLLLCEGVVTGSVGGMSLGKGHGRRGSYRDLPLPRMACTYLEKGRDDPSEILASTPKGLYIRSLLTGDVDPATGRITLVVDEGFFIDEGRLTRPISESLIIANAYELLGSIDAIADDLSFDHGAGDCIKRDQRVPVMVGLPTIRTGVARVIAP